MAPDADGDLMTNAPGLTLLTITDKGYGKRTAIDEYRVQPETGKPRSQSRGGKGRVDINLTDKNGQSVIALGAMPGQDLVAITKQGQLVRLPADSIRECGRGSQGVRVVGLKEGDTVVSAALVMGSGETPAEPSAEEVPEGQ
jgi:DNA gyrase subunit A